MQKVEGAAGVSIKKSDKYHELPLVRRMERRAAQGLRAGGLMPDCPGHECCLCDKAWACAGTCEYPDDPYLPDPWCRDNVVISLVED